MTEQSTSDSDRPSFDPKKFGLPIGAGKKENAESADIKPPEVSLAETDSSGAGSFLLGSIGHVESFYFPPELIGGCCPRVVGEEEDIVWNAAAEAADSERIHVAWRAKGDKIWYLAVRSSELASYPNSWCPFASLLPGEKDAMAPPVVYTYFSDETATMMTVMSDALHIHRGTTSVVRAKAERTARELGGAPIIDMGPDKIEKMTPMPWFSLSLFEDRARRILAAASVFGALMVTGLVLLVWFVSTMAMMSAYADVDEIKKRTEEKSLRLMQSVQSLRASPMREQLAKFADVNDGLLALNGYLELYQIKSNKVVWRAILPPSVTSDRIGELGGQTLDSNDQGVIIGNSREALSAGGK